jgi:hypothetical protein
MKKFLLPIALLVLVLSSCSKTESKTDWLKTYVQAYQSVSLCMDVAMDPFQVAHRLNLYLEGGETEALRQQLFPNATVKRADDGQSYTLTYTEAPSQPALDYNRSGVVIVHTHGAKLSEKNALWEIETDNEYPYFVNYPNYGYWYLVLDPKQNVYQIENNGTNRWNVRGDEFYLSDYSAGAHTNWSLDLIVTRVDNGGANLSAASFKVESGQRVNGGLIRENARYRYQTESPVYYSFTCGYNGKTSGKEQLLLVDNYDWAPKDSMRIDRGTNPALCRPNFEFSYKSQSDTTWTIRSYDSNGNWIDQQ